MIKLLSFADFGIESVKQLHETVRQHMLQGATDKRFSGKLVELPQREWEE